MLGNLGATIGQKTKMLVGGQWVWKCVPTPGGTPDPNLRCIVPDVGSGVLSASQVPTKQDLTIQPQPWARTTRYNPYDPTAATGDPYADYVKEQQQTQFFQTYGAIREGAVPEPTTPIAQTDFGTRLPPPPPPPRPRYTAPAYAQPTGQTIPVASPGLAPLPQPQTQTRVTTSTYQPRDVIEIVAPTPIQDVATAQPQKGLPVWAWLAIGAGAYMLLRRRG